MARTKGDTFRVERSTTIDAPAGRTGLERPEAVAER